MNSIKDNIIKIVFAILLIGISVIIIFALFKPFNDWSFNTNPELFGQYGDFIGGFIGTLFSLVAVLLLYETLKAQQEAIEKQDNALLNQKKVFEIERFEVTFFNLLKTHQEITEGIKAYFFLLGKNFATVTNTVHSRDFFVYSKVELEKIWRSIDDDEYLGVFDEDDIHGIQNEIDNLYDSNGSNYIDHILAKGEENSIIDREKLKLVNKQYGISKAFWESAHNQSVVEKIKIIYGLFFQNYHYAIGHYYRHLYHIINFVEQFELSNSDPQELTKKYIDFIQAQMSSFEMVLLFYNAMSFPKLLRLLVNYNFLENLAVEDLIDESHNCINGINLKKRKDLLGNN